jgi:hypothetical protein
MFIIKKEQPNGNLLVRQFDGSATYMVDNLRLGNMGVGNLIK